MKTIKTEKLYRSFDLQRQDVDEESRTVELAFSSEEPVDRWFGREILDHTPASIRLARMQNAGPLLVDHDPSDHVGVVESVSVDSDRRGRARVRFGRSARAEEIFRDVVDGIRRHVSVGYRIHKAVLEQESKDGPDEYRVTDWEPLEISIVAVPADATVGVGRAGGDEFETLIEIPEKERAMSQEVQTPPAVEQRKQPEINVESVRDEARKAEQERVRKILAIGQQFDAADLARQFVDNGRGVDELKSAILERMGSKHQPVPSPELGMSEREVKQFSFLRAINALANPTDRRAQQAAAYEFEVSQATAEKLGRDSRGITVAADILKRDLTVGTATAGGHTVATDLLAGSFIDMLVNRTVVFPRVTRLMDLVGNVAIPRQTSGATAYWVAESGAPTESQQAFDQVTLSPKTVGAFTDFSRKLMLQSSMDVEGFVRRDLAGVVGRELDRVCINGSGASNQPTGILNTTGIGDVAGGTNGAAPTWGNVVDLESEVANDNADIGSLFYITNTKVRGKLKQTEKASGTAQFVWDGDSLNGYAALVSNQVPSDLTKGTSTGVCSAVIFGNLADLLVGMWGGLDLMVDPYTGSTSGTVRVVALQDVDIAVRHAESFAAMKDALTA